MAYQLRLALPKLLNVLLRARVQLHVKPAAYIAQDWARLQSVYLCRSRHLRYGLLSEASVGSEQLKELPKNNAGNTLGKEANRPQGSDVLIEDSDGLSIIIVICKHPQSLDSSEVSTSVLNILGSSRNAAEHQVPAVQPSSIENLGNSRFSATAFDQLVDLATTGARAAGNKQILSLCAVEHEIVT